MMFKMPSSKTNNQQRYGVSLKQLLNYASKLYDYESIEGYCHEKGKYIWL